MWLDTEGLLLRFARKQPWEDGDALQDHIKSIEQRSPLLHWTFRHQTPLLGLKIALGSPSAVVPALVGLQTSPSERCEELKAALRRVTPVFFELVSEAAREEPASAPRLYRRVVQALSLLGTWRGSVMLKLAPSWRYALMNAFLRQLIVTISDCQAVLEQREELLLHCDAHGCDA